MLRQSIQVSPLFQELEQFFYWPNCRSESVEGREDYRDPPAAIQKEQTLEKEDMAEEKAEELDIDEEHFRKGEVAANCLPTVSPIQGSQLFQLLRRTDICCYFLRQIYAFEKETNPFLLDVLDNFFDRYFGWLCGTVSPR